SLYTISDYVGFEVLGWSPFSSSYEYFVSGGDDLQELSYQLIQTANSLEVNAQDMERLGEDFADMSSNLDAVSTKFAQLLAFPFSEFKGIITYLLIFIGILHLMFVFAGVNFLLLKSSV
ncbi:hypothetical protein KY339_05375, partial [Candidatus Woesearchaeota archaeon]|nr:hypothetical protein [Candidatus Woesearchaeota archaeon]